MVASVIVTFCTQKLGYVWDGERGAEKVNGIFRPSFPLFSSILLSSKYMVIILVLRFNVVLNSQLC